MTSCPAYLLQRRVRHDVLVDGGVVREVAQKDAGEGPTDLPRVVVGEGLEGGAVRRGGAELVRGDVGDEDLEPGVRQGEFSEGRGAVNELGQGGVQLGPTLLPDRVHHELRQHPRVLPPCVEVVERLDVEEAQLEAPGAPQRPERPGPPPPW